MRYYPVCLNVRGRSAVVVGGGRVAERKVRTLLRCGARVRIISPALTARLRGLAVKRRIEVTRRRYRKGDLNAGARRMPLLVFAATDDAATQRAVREEAEGLGILVNTADDRDHSTFLVPASFAQGDLQVAISTSGASPALARSLRKVLQATIAKESRSYLGLMTRVRKTIIKSIPTQRERARLFRQLVEALLKDWFGGRRNRSRGKPAVRVYLWRSTANVRGLHTPPARPKSGVIRPDTRR